MRHSIDVERLGPQGQVMAGPIEACVHCGFCLPTCPTYVTMAEEMDSPRGRIVLIKEVLEGKLELETALPYVDNCLGCQACVTACPSGVQYGDLITSFRAHAEERRARPALRRAERALMLRTLTHPRRLRLAARLGRAVRPGARWLGASPAAMLKLLPEAMPPRERRPDVFPALGTRRARVAMLAGCAQQVLAPDINAAALRVLARNGVETVVPPAQGCCGSLAMHTGAGAEARKLARRNLAAFGVDVDAIVTTTAGCGSGMREYGTLFKGHSEAEQAHRFAGRVLDISAFLVSLGLSATPPPLRCAAEIAYQDACHLAHAQGVRDAPRELLRSIEGVTLREPAEWQLCCGSAGTYNVEKPQTAAALGERKARNILATGASLLASGNIGCLIQLRAHLDAVGSRLPALHTIQVLDRAYASTLEEAVSDERLLR